MVRHCVVFRFHPGTDPDAIAALAEALRGLPPVIPEIEAYQVGADLGLRDTNADFAVVADFADADAFAVYSGHPAHLDVIRAFVEPITADRHAVQFQVS